MPILDLFSRRKKQSDGAYPDVYQYRVLPNNLRVQLVYVLSDAIGDQEQFHDHYSGTASSRDWADIRNVLRREYGLFHLTGKDGRDRDAYVEVVNFFLETDDVERALDVVELALRIMDFRGYSCRRDNQTAPGIVVQEFNQRMKEAGAGFQYSAGKIVRIDSDYTHEEIIKPALNLLQDKRYSTAQDEFLQAHGHYRAGEYRDCIADCGNSLESMLKIILAEKGHRGTEKLAASALINEIFEEGVVPSSMQSNFNSLRSLLSSGVPVIRNKYASHGHGVVAIDVPEAVASLAMNQTAAVLLFLGALA